MRYSTESEIISAAQAAHAIEFIRRMPQGMQTLIGDHGTKLSREQCRHIAIAQILLKNPPILIIDEIATTLNPESENLMRSALDNLMQNRTTIIIARRKVTLEKVDRIIVIDENRIKEIGSHKELLSEGGLYMKLYSLYH
jgi:subfamily B ATP-binding cassette protein MsbA